MTEQEAYQNYLEAQGHYASELQRFRDSARPNMIRLVEVGTIMNRARKEWFAVKNNS